MFCRFCRNAVRLATIRTGGSHATADLRIGRLGLKDLFGRVAADDLLTVKKSFYGAVLRGNLIFWLFGVLASGGKAIYAHDVVTTKITWAREISRIFYRRCTSCHHQGGDAFDLSTYEKARPWAEAIKEEVLERRMPPWGAVKGFGSFRNDDGLTQEEIEIIAGWAEGGAPLGDVKLLPSRIVVSPRQSFPKTDGSLIVSGNLTLKRTAIVAGVRPESLPEGASLQLIAERPDGSVEPLIWLYKYASHFARTYYFQAPLPFQAGTIIRMQPTAGSVALLLTRR